jgi:rhodanese-related sulfurtransferase
MNETVTCSELVQRLAHGAVAVDVMTPEEYAECHLAGAVNACIYEMVFLERLAANVADRSRELVVYDATGTTRTAPLARERLLQAGYANVAVLSGGLAAWRAAGLPLEQEESAPAEAALQDGAYRIDTENSRLEWIGRNLNNRHYGRIDVQDGELVISEGRLAAGNIVLDMNTISNFDLQDQVMRELLIRHLKSDDFFAVERFPIATFTLTGRDEPAETSAQAPEGVCSGNLTIRDVSRQLSIPAIVAPQADGSIKAHAAFDIDRTLWNVCYGSCRLFERLGMHLVHDLISLELFITARK